MFIGTDIICYLIDDTFKNLAFRIMISSLKIKPLNALKSNTQNLKNQTIKMKTNISISLNNI